MQLFIIRDLRESCIQFYDPTYIKYEVGKQEDAERQEYKFAPYVSVLNKYTDRVYQ